MKLFADCKQSYISVFPKSKTVHSNSLFFIEAYGTSESLIKQLNKKHQIYLKSGNKRINLIVIEILKGDKHISIAKLKPEKTLELGTTYQMAIDSLNTNMTFDFSTVSYTVNQSADTKKPILISKPKYKSKTLVYYGCGPESFVNFQFKAKDSSELMIKTILKNLKTGKTQTYYVTPNNNEIKVGYGMCSGAFNLESGTDYHVQFNIIDASGNSSSGNNKVISFTAS